MSPEKVKIVKEKVDELLKKETYTREPYSLCSSSLVDPKKKW
jgi:hypothetical protein